MAEVKKPWYTRGGIVVDGDSKFAGDLSLDGNVSLGGNSHFTLRSYSGNEGIPRELRINPTSGFLEIFSDKWKLVAPDGDMLKSVYDPTGINASPFARTNHTGAQAINTITGLQTALDNGVKRANHTGEQAISTVTNLQTALDNGVKRANHTGVQAISTVTGLQTALDNGVKRANHTGEQAISTVTNLQTALDNGVKRANHTGTQAINTVTGLQTALNNGVKRSNHTGTQAISTVTGLQTALDSKQIKLGRSVVVGATTKVPPNSFWVPDSSGGGVEALTPTTVSDGDIIYMRRKGGYGGIITLNASTGQTIEGGSSYVLAKDTDWAVLRYNGSDWEVMSEYKS
ncbi:hypothetical protein VPHK469_0235 [Vibrio phage K469]